MLAGVSRERRNLDGFPRRFRRCTRATSPSARWDEVAKTLECAASHYRDGEATGFENVAKYVTAELAYTVEIERCQAKVEGRDDITPIAVRTTTVFRLEDGTWKVVHRHTDPITTPQPAESVIQE